MIVRDLMSTDLHFVEPDTNLYSANEFMWWHNIRHFPVIDKNKKFVGLLTKRDVLRNTLSSLQNVEEYTRKELDRRLLVSDVMRSHIVTVSPDRETVFAATLMRHERIGCLPVMEKDHLIGILTEADFLKLAWERKIVWGKADVIRGEKPMEPLVRDYMTPNPFTLRYDDWFPSAEVMMNWRKIKHIPVLNERREVIGILTHRDLLQALLTQQLPQREHVKKNFYDRFTVQDVMTKPVITTTKLTTLRDAAEEMIEKKISCLLVMENKKLEGIITEADYLKLAVKL